MSEETQNEKNEASEQAPPPPPSDKKQVEISLINPMVALSPEIMQPVAMALKTLVEYQQKTGAKGLNARGWGYTFTIRPEK
ncbi:hypothetical protein SCOR_09405 [Sulfidibacter corallicola]|uniref:Uncharacterized protein n=1 Tax=Sulfidibacter corallicola TaxID=2818388 RepID=A0A8A4TM37_SULCO|nr:hypothetical protein [Sulfidibacter corallicola]QTD51026.1 hypothetical protein J3U87_01035 [Sulfidibacter corallicola]